MKSRLAFILTLVSMLMLASPLQAAEVVNLNKANAAAIQQNLIGIGPIKAEAIVSFRKKNGKYKNIDDLLNVKGIGPALIKKNKRYLSLTKGAVSGDDKAYAAAKKKAKSSKSSTKKKKKTTSTTSKSTSKSSSKSTSKKNTDKKSKPKKKKKKKAKKPSASTT